MSEFSGGMYYSSPEYGNFLQDRPEVYNSTELELSFNQSQILFNRSLTTLEEARTSAVRTQSLLNPDNIHYFYYYCTSGDDRAILMNRFQLTSLAQVDALFDYMTN